MRPDQACAESRSRGATVGVVGTIALFCLVTLFTGCAKPDRDKPDRTSADPSVGSNVAQAIMAEQLPLVNVANRISKLDATGIGLGGIQVEVDKRTVDVWWKGDQPVSLHEEISRQERAGGITINVRPAKYSQRELLDAARVVATNREAYPSSLVSIGPLVDGSALEVGLTDTTQARALRFPVTVKVVLAQRITQTSRADDSPPWWAGAVTHALPPAGNCSTGFAVGTYFGASQTSRGILTAEHCWVGGNTYFFDGKNEMIGMADRAPRHPTGPMHSESLYIRSNSNSRTYDGGVFAATSKPVVDQTGNFPGMFVCTSGAATGTHCNIKIDRTELLTFNPLPAEGTVEATEVAGNVATGRGDSGGPVYILGSDINKVIAAGMMIAEDLSLSALCPIPGQTACSPKVFYVDLGRILMDQGVSLLTQ